MHYVPPSSFRLMHHTSLAFFKRWNCATRILHTAFIIQRRRPQSTIIQVRALLLTTQSEQQLVVDSVHLSEKGHEQACTVASAVVNFPTDGNISLKFSKSPWVWRRIGHVVFDVSKERDVVFFRGLSVPRLVLENEDSFSFETSGGTYLTTVWSLQSSVVFGTFEPFDRYYPHFL